jgi:membrane protease YdiL (CAAX protease family)
MNAVVSAQPAVVETQPRKTVNWPHVGAYIGLTFGLSWLLDLVLYLNGGLTTPAAKLMLQLQMLLPAFAALVLGVFFFKESPVYRGTNRTASRWFIYYYFLMTGVYLVAAIIGLVQPDLATPLSGGLLILSLIGLVLLGVLRWRGGKQSFAGVGMAFGRIRLWLLYGLAMTLFYGLETLLNYVFKLGTPVDISALIPGTSMPAPALLAAMFFNTAIIGPVLGLIITFGEEYGWRGYLQGELVRLGRVRGVGLLGVIWGAWHWPMIWMGYNYPGEPLWGSLLMTGYTVVLSYFLAYAVFKSKGLWTAAYLHALNNQVMSFFMGMVVTPVSIALSFGIGLPALALCAVVVLLLLRDPVWKERD